MKRLTMKQLPKADRPYEKLKTQGPESLTEAELLAIILRTGTKEERSVEVAQKLLLTKDCNENLANLYNFSLEELQQISGIGSVKAIQISAALELSKRISKSAASKHFNVSNPLSIASFYMEQMRYYQEEHFKVVFLNIKNDIIKDKDITIGNVNTTIVVPRDVFKEAIKIGTTKLILLHNHPSGDPMPSSNDIQLTKNIVKTGKLIGIEILDHIIIGNGKYFSMKNQNIL